MIKNNKSRAITCICLFLTFVIPVVIAQYLFKNAARLHLATTNHGTLITPPIPATQLPFKPLMNQWTLLYNSATCCDKNCLMNILVTHQIIKSFGADRSRLRPAILLPLTCSADPITQQFFKDSVTTEIIRPENASPKNNLHLAGNHLYIIDPHGNLMMFYKKNYNPLDLYNDLSQLLRVSSIG